MLEVKGEGKELDGESGSQLVGTRPCMQGVLPVKHLVPQWPNDLLEEGGLIYNLRLCFCNVNIFGFPKHFYTKTFIIRLCLFPVIFLIGEGKGNKRNRLLSLSGWIQY